MAGRTPIQRGAAMSDTAGRQKPIEMLTAGFALQCSTTG
jgi:hypothetical protein